MTRLVFVAVALALAGIAQASGNAEAGKQKASQVCAACHGPSGAQPTAPENPILAGQHYDYLVKALQDYKSGKRSNAIMKGFAAALSARDIEDLAAWFASQPSGLHYQR
ncbi:MAG: cytochrome c [Betaproteobacteria bacterium]|nr:cytochrome c [Betaproteobacteria bacterium]MDH5210605.1 cytochrome c [Betaproteobacteria bacterium]MDH5576961.1 cytochrome c [Betaproteobacteria bacterium]